MKTGIEIIAEERKRGMEVEGWTPEHDDQHHTGDLAHAAAAYASAELYRRATSPGYDNTPHIWPFERKWWKPSPHDRIKELAKAGALIASEIDRLNRVSLASKKTGIMDALNKAAQEETYKHWSEAINDYADPQKGNPGRYTIDDIVYRAFEIYFEIQ